MARGVGGLYRDMPWAAIERFWVSNTESTAPPSCILHREAGGTRWGCGGRREVEAQRRIWEHGMASSCWNSLCLRVSQVFVLRAWFQSTCPWSTFLYLFLYCDSSEGREDVGSPQQQHPLLHKQQHLLGIQAQNLWRLCGAPWPVKNNGREGLGKGGFTWFLSADPASH